MKTNQISRRNFVKLSGAGTGSLILGLYVPTSLHAAKIIKASDPESFGVELNAWVHINMDGKVTIFSHRAEMGQGVYQAIPQIVCEELEVSLDDVNIVFAKGDNKKYGSQVTGGSSTVRGSYKNLLKLGATARTMLIMAAAAKWNVPASECYAEAGHVIHKPSENKFHYGELVEEAAQLDPPSDIVLKSRSEYKLIGKSMPRQDIPLKVNGTAVFGLDKALPGMMYAMVERSPKLHGKIKTFDDTEARKIPGVKDVFKVKMGVFTLYREGVAVVADNTWAALQGKRALTIEWDDSGFEQLNSEDIRKKMDGTLLKNKGLVQKKQGDADSIIDNAEDKIDITYHTPFQSHSPIEPLNCVAHYQEDKVEIWGPIQAPEWVQDYISTEMGIEREKIIVNMTFLGGGFGRKAFMDYPHEATVISKHIGGPVQVVWTREDEMTQGPWRPGIAYRCEAVLENSDIKAMRVRFVGQNEDHMRRAENADRTRANWGTSEGFPKPYYDSIENISFYDVPFELPTVPIMWWRSVYASTNGFAYDGFLDVLATESKTDPMDFRRKYMKDDRSQKLIDKLEKVSGWKNRGKGYGVGITECFRTTVGQVVKVSKKANGNGVQIDHVWVVVDCGWYVNPNIIKAQVEGAIIMAMGAATSHEITFEAGQAMQSNFDSYPLPRISDTPEIEVFIMDNEENAGGVGEPGLPPFAPALANAIYNLTGKRIYNLPFKLNEVV
ncbi:molybdopterin cofactor-binding domain-containing protein [Allomuricauda sp. NBRC 101325]|uniref:molybdopterin cofactor-binding domain-containing protein n=1 Tax=Allomuricauda sp. NBRC 101325 TaxID=1113758 RepID=UPI0024A220AD|nr:molybdopterin cofactor-binding domain-containing protein [Muricauda sp. NBRC 101325]GLU45145.1 oxidoreductase [Muricauda sp. NBRC 101325]